jgi:hypothetical protein
VFELCLKCSICLVLLFCFRGRSRLGWARVRAPLHIRGLLIFLQGLLVPCSSKFYSLIEKCNKTLKMLKLCNNARLRINIFTYLGEMGLNRKGFRSCKWFYLRPNSVLIIDKLGFSLNILNNL